MSYDDMLHLLNLPPLHARRRYLKLDTSTVVTGFRSKAVENPGERSKDKAVQWRKIFPIFLTAKMIL